MSLTDIDLLNEDDSSQLELLLGLNQDVYQPGERFTIFDGWVRNPVEDNQSTTINIQIQNPDGTWVDYGSINSIQPWEEDSSWGRFEFNLNNLIGFAPGEYVLWAEAVSSTQGVTRSEKTTTFTVDNAAPTGLLFDITIDPERGDFVSDSGSLVLRDTLTLQDAWIRDLNGTEDLERVDFWIQLEDGSWQDVEDATEFTSWSEGVDWSSFEYELDLSGLTRGTSYTLWGQAADDSGATSGPVTIDFEIAGTPATINASDNADVLTGANGTYILGDETGALYNQDNNNDYAILQSFDRTTDTIRLNGSPSDYILRVVEAGSVSGIGIYDSSNDLIAIVEDSAALSLNGSYFDYI